MHFAVRAECFCFHKRTAVASLCGIVGKRLTFGAKSVLRAVLFPAIELYHKRDRFLFALTLIVDIHKFFLSLRGKLGLRQPLCFLCAKRGLCFCSVSADGAL